MDLDGFVVKKDSPSCGLERVRVYPAAGGAPTRDTRGLFTQALLDQAPLLPIEEEGRLQDARLRDNFLVRVYAHRRLRALFTPRWPLCALVAFHTQAKLLLLAHDEPAYRALGRLVARAKAMARADAAAEYRRLFLGALARVPRPGQHVNVLEHMAGFLRGRATAAERAELGEAIADYRAGHAPRAVPLALIRHQARRYDVAYLLAQTYLLPYPKALMPAHRP
jgi:uncharacterized protein YbgA (DUF1722 family)